MHSYFNDTGKLVRFILRRERVMSVVWLVMLVFITVIVPPALSSMYEIGPETQSMAETMKNPAMIAMMGPVYGADNYNIGAMTSNFMLLFTIIGVAIMNIFFVVRHTRGDEERGRIEVIRSLPVGRLSNLSATMIAAFGINLVLALLSGFALYATGIESLDFSGSILYGVAMGVSGLFFAAITSLFAQLSANSRGVVLYSLAFLGIFYMMRAAGDINNEVIACISPLGLILRTQVYVKNFWWPVFIIILLTIIVTAAAFCLNYNRDMNQGIIPEKPGRRTASAMLGSPLGLALRLQRTTLIGWFIGMFVFGAAYGSIMGDLEAFLKSNELLMQILPTNSGYSVTELFITMLMSILSLTGTIPVLTSMLTLRSEEKRNQSEHILARVVSRTKYMASYFSISLVNSFIMLFAAVFGLWSASAVVMETPINFLPMFKAMMVYLPAVWFMLGITVLLIGALPEKSGLCWAYLGFSFFVIYIGRVMQFPEWVKKLSPFGYIPELPMDTINYTTLAVFSCVSIIMMAAGFFFYKKRDVLG